MLTTETGLTLGCNAPTSPVEACTTQEVTRVELLALRNNSELDITCVYKIPYSRGCLTDVFIYLRAADVNLLSHHVEVQTVWDNELWEGKYSIDSNRVLELHDNLGNYVGGRFGNEVDRFAWGRNNVWGNVLYNSDVFMNCDTTQAIYENTWHSNAYTDLRNFQGNFSENTIDSYGRVYLNSATTVDFRRNKIQSLAYVYFNGAVDNIFIRQNTIADNSYVRKFSAATGRFTLIDSLIARGDVRHYAGTCYINSVDVLSSGRIYARNQATNDFRYSTVSDLTYINTQATSGIFRFWYSSAASYTRLYERTGITGGNRYIYYSNFESCQFDMRSGSGNWFVYYHKQMSNGYMRADSANGTIRLYQNTLGARGEIRLNNISGNSNIYYNTVQSYPSRIYLNGTTTANVQYNTLSSYGRIDLNGGTPRVVYCDFDSIGILTCTNYTDATGIVRAKISSDARLNVSSGSGRVYACTFQTSFTFNTNGTTTNYVTGIGNITHTATANNTNRGNFHNLVNNLV